ncbi:energy-coupling factor transporter transmembrane protein EcfT [Nocardioides acrostichi]|uniref:Energy-coupling factor transporter transmembrane protein EcfT n=1 Tax=Nocardioides acrostichi TaxID=2784339 RepID=A0A930UUF3_9ACTN|nr:energy-coupling factor transporter transmembrane protein EcfT [Nocardioides acrostichi]MBF4160391.1 energy-coupling factor transporter transmembrane protein EcfT [Nocardioides acrostichi]
MSQPSFLAVYRPGDSVLHHARVGVKVGGLVAFSLVVVVVRGATLGLAVGGAMLALAVVACLVGGLGLRASLRALRPLLVMVVALGTLQWVFYGPSAAAETALDLLALALAATVVSATTAVNAMLDAFVRWLRPLRAVGVRPERVALTFSLAIAALPGTLALALETRDAARARGLGRHPRAFLTPLVIRVVARAHETGDALAARGLADID